MGRLQLVYVGFRARRYSRVKKHLMGFPVPRT
nr:MAG TPA: hypothetical protein [Caudoviricetes sp.]